MADVQINGTRTRSAPATSTSQRTIIRVDLTPMVDLGFLLITFFMLTTVLAKPQIMPVVMPDDKLIQDPPAVKASTVLTLLLGSADKVYWYEGADPASVYSTDYSPGGLRQIILDKKARVYQAWGDELRADPKRPGGFLPVSRLTILIKAAEGARFKNMVDALDEMKICGIGRYMLLRISDREHSVIQDSTTRIISPQSKELARPATRRI